MARVEIKRDFCKSCGLCIQFCPSKILDFDEKLNKLGFRPAYAKDGDKCVACLNCVLMCPEACIEIYEK